MPVNVYPDFEDEIDEKRFRFEKIENMYLRLFEQFTECGLNPDYYPLVSIPFRMLDKEVNRFYEDYGSMPFSFVQYAQWAREAAAQIEHKFATIANKYDTFVIRMRNVGLIEKDPKKDTTDYFPLSQLADDHVLKEAPQVVSPLTTIDNCLYYFRGGQK